MKSSPVPLDAMELAVTMGLEERCPLLSPIFLEGASWYVLTQRYLLFLSTLTS